MVDIKAQLKDKSGNNLYPVTSMAYVTANFSGGLQFNSSTNTLSTYRIPIASVSQLNASLTAKQAKCVPGYRTEIDGATVAQMRYFDLTSTVSAGSLTLSAGCAYRIFATGNVVTLNAETFNNNQFGLEGHATILVTNNSYLTLGSNVVLGAPLMNDAVNNCTLRFHDGHCIIDIEDHDAAHTVTVASGTGSGTLYYYCASSFNSTDETPTFISISDALDRSLVSFNGAVIEGERHIAGNGINRTSLTSSFTPNSKTYLTHTALYNLTAVTGGTVHATDVYVPAGASATFSSPLYAYETLTVDGTLNTPGTLVPANGIVISGSGTLNLAQTQYSVPISRSVYLSGCTVYNGAGASGGVFNLSYASGKVEASNCVFSGNSATARGGVFMASSTCNIDVTDCTFIGNSSLNGAVIQLYGGNTRIVGCVFSSNTASTGAGFTDQGHGSCYISGASFVDCSANYGAAVYGGNNASFSLESCIFSGNSAVNFGGCAYLIQSTIAHISGCRFINNVAGSGAHLYCGASAGAADITDCIFSGGTANAGQIMFQGSSAAAAGCVITGNLCKIAGGCVVLVNNTLPMTLTDCIITGNTFAAAPGIAVDLRALAKMTLSNCTIEEPISPADNNSAVNIRSGGTCTIAGHNTLGRVWCAAGGSVVIESGASTSVTRYISGSIVVNTGGCTVNGTAIAAGTYARIVSSGGSAVAT